MPFRRRARVTITSDLPEHINVAYQITYAQTEVPDGAGYLHAQWRRAHHCHKICPQPNLG